jgi:hypothetical protein
MNDPAAGLADRGDIRQRDREIENMSESAEIDCRVVEAFMMQRLVEIMDDRSLFMVGRIEGRDRG